MKKIICIQDNSNYKITAWKIYDIIDETPTQYKITNDKNQIAKYSKKFFRIVRFLLPKEILTGITKVIYIEKSNNYIHQGSSLIIQKMNLNKTITINNDSTKKIEYPLKHFISYCIYNKTVIDFKTKENKIKKFKPNQRLFISNSCSDTISPGIYKIKSMQGKNWLILSFENSYKTNKIDKKILKNECINIANNRYDNPFQTLYDEIYINNTLRID